MYLIIKKPNTVIDTERDVSILTDKYVEEPITIGSFSMFKKTVLCYIECV